ncbi:MAG: putative signal transducing protein [Dysgonomonas sp.]
MELVTVKTSQDYNHLAIAKTYLEDSGIICSFKDEYASQVYSHTYAVGGIKLQVQEEDVQRAMELLIEGGFATKEDYEIPESTMQIVNIVEKIKSLFRRKK